MSPARLFISVALSCVFCFSASATTLTGKVVDEEGRPLGGARVSIYTAKPRKGLSVTCPSCYRDCAKSTTTDKNGNWTIEKLDDSLLFRVLMAAVNMRSAVTKHVDPDAGPVEASLKMRPADLEPEHFLAGRVVDLKGKPIVGALVTPFGAKTKERRWWGRMPGVDELAVTDAEGKFVIVTETAKSGMDLKVRGRDYTTTITPLLELNGKQHEIKLRHGASVRGRLVYKGKPVAGRAIGMVQTSRRSGQFIGETTYATDENGRFSFDNLLPDEEYALYSLTDGDTSNLALKTQRLTTAGDTKSTDLDEIELIEGLQFSGKIIIASGGKVPKDSTLRLSRKVAWDWKTIPVAEDGTFDATGLPPEVYEVGVQVAGSNIDTKGFRYQMLGDNSFGIRLRESRSDFLIPLK